jgi:leucine-rich PPR motif-containing protein
MVRVGVRPDAISYTILMDGHCLAGRMKEAMKLLDDMVRVGLKPNATSYNTLLHGYCRARLFREMLSNEVRPGIVSYTTVLQGLFRSGKFSEAKGLYLNMIKSGISWTFPRTI